MGTWLAVPKDWLAALGDIVKFSARVFGEVFRLRVFSSSARRCARPAS